MHQAGSVLMELGCALPHTVTEQPLPGTMTALIHQSGCNICFLDIAGSEEHALQLAAETAALIPVVVLSPMRDADLILRCLRVGVREFVCDPTVEQIGDILERLARARTSMSPPSLGTVYCVIPGKPGCGASTLAAHLAVQFGAHGAAKVLLVDADPLTSGIAFMLKLKTGFHLGDVLRDWNRMDEDLWSRLRTRGWGIDLLLAPENPATALGLNREIAADLMAFWRARYDTIFLDTPDIGAAGNYGFAAEADHLLLVTTNELPALHAARRALAYLDETASARTKLKLIVNRYNPASGLKQSDLNAALDAKPYAILSNDYKALQDALLEGKPVAEASSFGRGISALSRQLRGGSAALPASGQKTSASWFRFLHRGK